LSLNQKHLLFVAGAACAVGAAVFFAASYVREATPAPAPAPAVAVTVPVQPKADPPTPAPTPAPAPKSTPPSAAAAPATQKYAAGEDPAFAAKMGWPVKGPEPLPGAILPSRRIVAYYGNPLSKQMGVLGQYEPEEMFRRFDLELEGWRKADPATPVVPAFHLIAIVAQAEPGPTRKYRTIMRDALVETVYGWAKAKNAIMFLDIQTGHSDVRDLVPRLDTFLIRPDVHLALDPEFALKASGRVPGTKVGVLDAADINYASEHLADLVRKHNLPPKVLVIHRFTRNMVTNSGQIKLRPEVQLVMHMDGWGASWLKRDTYRDYIVREPVQYTGFKIFYHNDTKKGDPLLTPPEVLRLRPVPVYIQYQ
jgi:hypothetical protein